MAAFVRCICSSVKQQNTFLMPKATNVSFFFFNFMCILLVCYTLNTLSPGFRFESRPDTNKRATLALCVVVSLNHLWWMFIHDNMLVSIVIRRESESESFESRRRCFNLLENTIFKVKRKMVDLISLHFRFFELL